MDELVSIEGPAEDFDRLAAALRADSGDLSTFLEVVASKFESALPGRTRVERGGGMLRRRRPVNRVSLELGDLRFELARSGGAVAAPVSYTHLYRRFENTREPRALTSLER